MPLPLVVGTKMRSYYHDANFCYFLAWWSSFNSLYYVILYVVWCTYWVGVEFSSYQSFRNIDLVCRANEMWFCSKLPRELSLELNEMFTWIYPAIFLFELVWRANLDLQWNEDGTEFWHNTQVVFLRPFGDNWVLRVLFQLTDEKHVLYIISWKCGKCHQYRPRSAVD